MKEKASLDASGRSVQFQTRRLLLRTPHSGDRDFIVSLYTHKEIMKHISTGNGDRSDDGGVLTPEQAHDKFDNLIRFWRENGYGMLLVERLDDGSPAGYCGFKHWLKTDTLELGYLYDPHHWGRGIATEAASRCIEYAAALGADRLMAATASANTASQKVLAKLGFERLSRKTENYNGMPAHIHIRRLP